MVVVPNLIGVAIDDRLAGSNRGVTQLAAVSLVMAALATARRAHDTRLYARIYERASGAAVAQETGVSTKTARLNMLREISDFLEWTLPDLLLSLAGFFGSLMFLLGLDRSVFWAALAMALVVVGVYAFTTRRTVAFNHGFNNEYERQVDVLVTNDPAAVRRHVGLLNSWLIRLADLGAANVAVSLVLATALQVFAIVTAADRHADPGVVFSVVLYVVEFAAVAPFVPTTWQEYLRLRDIVRRFDAAAAPA